MTVKQGFVFFSVAPLLLAGMWSAYWPPAAWSLIVLLPVIAVGVYDLLQRRHTILRIYPVLGHVRFMFESVRKEIQQCFVESEIDGTPVNREFRPPISTVASVAPLSGIMMKCIRPSRMAVFCRRPQSRQIGARHGTRPIPTAGKGVFLERNDKNRRRPLV